MTKVINQCFGSYGQADLSGVTDVSAKAWYGDEMAKAAKMGAFQKDTQMRPNDRITRQEAFTVLARAFQLIDFTDTLSKAKLSDHRAALLIITEFETTPESSKAA